MNEDSQADFGRAMRLSLEATRAGDLNGATRLIQQALNGRPVEPTAEAGMRDATPAAGVLAGADGKRAPRREPEDAEIVSTEPPSGPRRARKPLGETLKGLARRGRMGGGRTGPASPPAIPDGARWEARRHDGVHGGRDYRLYVPSAVAGGQPARGLVVMLHGCTQNPEDFARGTTMNEQGEAHRLIVAYPEQDRAANAQVCWNWFRPGDQGTDGESGLLAELSRELSTEFCLAEGSAFVAGLSAGGAMAAIVAQAHPASFAAAGVHSGLAPGAASDVASAFAAMSGQGLGGAAGQGTARSAPLAVPTILFHGDADRTVVPSNSDHARRGLTGVSEARRSVGGRDARVVTGRTREGRAVELWRVAGAGHAWQGGDPAGSYADRQGPDASAEMMRFFLAQLPVGARQG